MNSGQRKGMRIPVIRDSHFTKPRTLTSASSLQAWFRKTKRLKVSLCAEAWPPGVARTQWVSRPIGSNTHAEQHSVLSSLGKR